MLNICQRLRFLSCCTSFDLVYKHSYLLKTYLLNKSVTLFSICGFSNQIRSSQYGGSQTHDTAARRSQTELLLQQQQRPNCGSQHATGAERLTGKGEEKEMHTLFFFTHHIWTNTNNKYTNTKCP